MIIRLLCCLTALAAATGANLAQETKDGGDPEKPRNAFVKIMNACDTSQNERWRTGLDLKFKDQTIGKDIRLGERGPTGKISFTGRDFIEVFRQGDDSRPLVRVPANLKAGGFYTLVVLGQLDADSAQVDVRVVEEYPVPEASDKKDRCRMQLVNAVGKFPVAIGIKNEKPIPISFGEIRELVFSPGAVDLGLFFQNSKGETQRLQSGLIAKPGDNLTAIVHPSAERPERPELLRVNAASDRVPALTADDVPQTSR